MSQPSLPDRTKPTALEQFIVDLRNAPAASEAVEPLPDQLEPSVRQVDRDADLVERFTETANGNGSVVHAASPADWTAVVTRVLRDAKADTVFLGSGDAGYLSRERIAGLTEVLQRDTFRILRKHDDETLFSVDAAVTGVAGAIAETGTIVCESAADTPRGASLIPPRHVAVVHASQIAPDVCDFFDTLADRSGLPANVTLITGPSKTADIEGILVTGVHGPGQLHIVLVRGV